MLLVDWKDRINGIRCNRNCNYVVINASQNMEISPALLRIVRRKKTIRPTPRKSSGMVCISWQLCRLLLVSCLKIFCRPILVILFVSPSYQFSLLVISALRFFNLIVIEFDCVWIWLSLNLIIFWFDGLLILLTFNFVVFHFLILILLPFNFSVWLMKLFFGSRLQ